MKNDKKIKVENIFAGNIYELDIHELANMNPMQNELDFLSLKHSIAEIGQQEPITVFKGKVVDGRNRLLALKQLDSETDDYDGYKIVKYKKLPNTLSWSELEMIVKAKETRRHLSPVQKAISALNYHHLKSINGEKIGMREAAKEYGVSTGMVSNILSLKKVAGEAVIQKLFNGDKVEILRTRRNGDVYKAMSDSPNAIRKHYESMLIPNESDINNIDPREMAFAQLETTKLISMMSYDGISYLIHQLETLRDKDNGCNIDLISKEIDYE